MQPYNNLSTLVHKEGYVFIILGVIITLVFASISSNLGWICFIGTVLCAYFFRNPNRVTPIGENLVTSSADGTVVSIEHTKPPAETGLTEEMLKVSVFLSVFDAHVNRIPISGQVVSLHYNPGAFFNASLDKASKHNERQAVVIEAGNGDKVVVVQIAGLIARRIVCDAEEGMQVKGGQRYGIIRFGSRVDIYLPSGTVPRVAVGQTVVAGETIIAQLGSNQPEALQFEAS